MTFLSRNAGIFIAAALCIAPTTNAQTITQSVAAQETYIPEIQLLPTSLSPNPAVVMTYVAQDTQPGGGNYYCGAMSQTRATEAARDVTAALNTLPQGAWNAITMRYILLCSEAKAGGRAIGGIPVPPIKLLMLSAGNSKAASPRLPMTALHELYHLIEMQQGRYNDINWNTSFAGYKNRYGNNDVTIGSGGEGFINAYGTSFPHEERAEIFANLLLDERGITRYLETTRDAILRQKIAAVKENCTAMLGNATC